MIYWLLIFSFDPSGNLMAKQEMQLSSKHMCELVAGHYPTKIHTGSVKTLCVSDDHHSGRKYDPGIALD